MPDDRCDRCRQGEPTRNPDLPAALLDHPDDEEAAYADLSGMVLTYRLCESCCRQFIWWWQSGRSTR